MFKIPFLKKKVPIIKDIKPSTEIKPLLLLVNRYLSDSSELSEKQVKYRIQEVYLHNRITLAYYRYLLNYFH